jgi:hypothetical protein
MGFAWTVTGFTAELLLLGFGASERFSHDGVLEVHTLICVANHAGITSGVFTACLC